MYVPEPFIVFALPRSRTAWLAQFLAGNGWQCTHDLVIECDTLAQLQHRLAQPMSGTVETGAMLGWRLLRTWFPRAKFAVVRRPVQEVLASLARVGAPADVNEIYSRNRLLDVIASQPGTMSVHFMDLAITSVCSDLFHHCTGWPPRPEHLRRFGELRIELDISRRLSRIASRSGAVAELKAEALAAVEALQT